MIITEFQSLEIRDNITINDVNKEKLLQNKIWIEDAKYLDSLNISSSMVASNSARVQKTVKFGKVPSFRVISIVVNNENNGIGLGLGKHTKRIIAKEKSINEAKKKIIFIKLGCGSLRCNKDCEEKHSILNTISGRCGSTIITLLPAEKGAGIVSNPEIKNIFEKLGVKDLRVKLRGSNNKLNCFKAIYEALINSLKL